MGKNNLQDVRSLNLKKEERIKLQIYFNNGEKKWVQVKMLV